MSVAVCVPENLHFDMSRRVQILLQQQRVVTERGLCLALGASDSAANSSPDRTMRMPLPPPPAEALTSTGIAEALGLCTKRLEFLALP